MLGSTNIVAFVPTKDATKARAFYEGVLGLRFVKDDGFATVLDANGIMVRVAKVPQFTPAQFTILGMGSCRHRKMVAEPAGERRPLREIRILRARRTGDMDRADRRQGGVVQRSRWKYAFRIPARRVSLRLSGVRTHKPVFASLI
jgi:catechol 2,3-dioxygenase-like lactoylglutathione lyase family enzyme